MTILQSADVINATYELYLRVAKGHGSGQDVAAFSQVASAVLSEAISIVKKRSAMNAKPISIDIQTKEPMTISDAADRAVGQLAGNMEPQQRPADTKQEAPPILTVKNGAVHIETDKPVPVTIVGNPSTGRPGDQYRLCGRSVGPCRKSFCSSCYIEQSND